MNDVMESYGSVLGARVQVWAFTAESGDVLWYVWTVQADGSTWDFEMFVDERGARVEVVTRLQELRDWHDSTQLHEYLSRF